jgi:hypothetical protein
VPAAILPHRALQAADSAINFDTQSNGYLAPGVRRTLQKAKKTAQAAFFSKAGI